MKKNLLPVFCFISLFASAQNLVTNGDFELYSGCPNNYSQIDSAFYWTSPTAPSTDYYNACDTTNFVGIPINVSGYQNAHSGMGYAGIYLYFNQTNNYREYLEVPLSTTLIANSTYHFKMYANLANTCYFTSDNLGVYFSDSLVHLPNINTPLLQFTTPIINIPGNYFDTLNWTLISGDYSATGGENYLIIGNFNNDANSNLITYNSATGFLNSYCYIDDVTLSLIEEVNEIKNNYSATIFPNPSGSSFTVQTNNNQPATIILYDLASRKVLETTFINTAILNTASLERGIYLYEIKAKAVTVKQGKMVKE